MSLYDPTDVVIRLAVMQIQRAEFARQNPDKCVPCNGSGDLVMLVEDAWGPHREVAVCGDCGGSGLRGDAA